VPQMQGVGRADDLLYFKCQTTKQMRCPVNAYPIFYFGPIDTEGLMQNNRDSHC
jgi:hypothetical protein